MKPDLLADMHRRRPGSRCNRPSTGGASSRIIRSHEAGEPALLSRIISTSRSHLVRRRHTQPVLALKRPQAEFVAFRCR